MAEIVLKLRPILPFVYCVFLSACGAAQMSKVESTPSPLPEARVIKAVDIVERADQMCKQQNDCRQALLLYDQAIKERGESADLFKKRGMAHYSLQEIEFAINDFSKAIDLRKRGEKQDVMLFFMRGLSRSLLEKEDRRSTCSDLRKAVELGYDLKADASFERWYVNHCSSVD